MYRWDTYHCNITAQLFCSWHNIVFNIYLISINNLWTCFILIIYHDFLLPSRRGSHVKSDYEFTIIESTLLSPYTWCLCLYFSSCTLFTVYFNPLYSILKVNSFSIIYIYIRALNSCLSFAHCRATSTVIALLQNATITTSINLTSVYPVPSLSYYHDQ